jgi:hypothetical protein
MPGHSSTDHYNGHALFFLVGRNREAFSIKIVYETSTVSTRFPHFLKNVLAPGTFLLVRGIQRSEVPNIKQGHRGELQSGNQKNFQILAPFTLQLGR